MPKLRALLCLLLCLLLTGCSAGDPLAPMAQQTPMDAAIPAPDADALAAQLEQSTLWFRFGSEPLLAPEVRQIAISPNVPYELALLQTLIAGPSLSSTELSGLFPPGTRVLSTYRYGRMLFVTLSRQIMNNYADEPEHWQPRDAWETEIPLRRKLAMQAIAATITQNCDIDQVVILVDQGAESSDSLRLRESYYRAGGAENALAAPLTRDEALLLSPQTTLSTILSCWSEQNWARLYRYIARHDPATGLERPDYETFAAQMDTLPHLTHWEAAGGSISHGGLYATFTIDASMMQNGQETALSGSLFRLCAERGIWRIGLSQLTEREVIVP